VNRKFFIAAAVLLAGCAVRGVDCSFSQMQEAVYQRSGLQPVWHDQLGDERQLLLDQVALEGLTPDRALRLALLNSPSLQALFEELAIGHAELVRAGLMRNPVFDFATRFPTKSGYSLDLVFDAAFAFIDLFLIPLRQEVAEAELSAIEARVGHQLLQEMKELQLALVHYQFLDVRLRAEEPQQKILDWKRRLALLQQQAGNISALQARQPQIEQEEHFQTLTVLREQLADARQQINRRLGLTGEIDWVMTEPLPAPTPVGQLDELLEQGINRRLDLEGIRREIGALAQRSRLSNWWVFTELMVGVSVEREPEGFTIAGPSVSLALPIWSYGQADRLALGGRIAQKQQELLAKAVEIVTSVRASYETAQLAYTEWQSIGEQLLPSLAQEMESSLAHYLSMTLGVYDLLDAKRRQFQGEAAQGEALYRYWKAQLELAFAAGGA
jgi:outer membrane protein, heavy metal efflux system